MLVYDVWIGLCPECTLKKCVQSTDFMFYNQLQHYNVCDPVLISILETRKLRKRMIEAIPKETICICINIA